jgi:hypothetical protein
MTAGQSLAPGTRVRVLGKPNAVELTTTTGVIARPGDYDGYYIVRLDSPAQYLHADGHTEALPEIEEYWDNLEKLSPVR